MYDVQTRRRALALVSQGLSLNSVSKQTGISRAAIRTWQDRVEPATLHTHCSMCGPEKQPPADRAAYAYLLALYLGDGCVSRLRRTHFLRIACADAWPGLIDECEKTLRAVRPENSVFRVQNEGCVMVTSASKHWLCLLPQHGPGRKHDRHIALEPWQAQIVGDHPWAFIRGLIHSDGCRITNWTTRMIGCESKRYEYPRYFFTNTSEDIIRLFTGTLDALGVEWKHLNQRRSAQTISVARRASVALMDAHVGPKY
jgi:hypothetical protein